MNNILSHIVDLKIIKKIANKNQCIKAIFVGEPWAFKSKVVNQFVDEQFFIQSNFIIKNFKIPSFDVELQFEIWDTV